MPGGSRQRRRVKRIDINQRRQLAGLAAYIADFQGQVLDQFMLDIKVVLRDIRRAQVRIHKEYAPAAERQEAGSVEVNVLGRSFGWKRIGRTRGCERVCHEAGGEGAGSSHTAIVEYRAGEAKEGRLSVELQVVFALEHVVENARTSTDAGAAVATWVPGKSYARSPVVLVGEVRALGRALVSREQQRCGRVYKAGGVRSGN